MLRFDKNCIVSPPWVGWLVGWLLVGVGVIRQIGLLPPHQSHTGGWHKEDTREVHSEEDYVMRVLIMLISSADDSNRS